jgi:hypothetical protein
MEVVKQKNRYSKQFFTMKIGSDAYMAIGIFRRLEDPLKARGLAAITDKMKPTQDFH